MGKSRGCSHDPNVPTFHYSSTRFFREVCPTVDEVNHNSKPKRTRILRATDVIPPFGKSTPPLDNGEAGVEPPQVMSAQMGEGGVTAGPLPTGAGEVPAYDLAENILAEQRRAAGRRRRGPGRMEPAAVLKRPGAKVSTSDWASQGLLELQRIVAEIVASDIERLCRRPDRSALVVCSLGAEK
jgi:hypothetical protein